METLPFSFYQSLDASREEIRLIRISPTLNNDDTIQCKLETASLSTSNLEYAALSYVWGDPKVTRDIHVNGEPFPVTENLHNALWQFRSSCAVLSDGCNSQIPLWVDSICINQKDVNERNQQVSMMGSIYSLAIRVISWLGTPGVEEGDAAIRTIRAIVRAAYKDEAKEINKASLLDFISSQPHLLGGDEKDENLERIHGKAAWKATIDLFYRPYWKRTWIVQEIVLVRSTSAHLLVCGNESTTFEDAVAYSRVVEFLGKDNIPEQLGFSHDVWNWARLGYPLGHLRAIALLREGYRQFRQGSAAKISAFALLHMSLEHQATDPRDFIYGFQAITNSNIVVDYSSSIKEVYLDWYNVVVRQGIPMDGSLHPILHAGIGLDESWQSDLPSWLPNLSRLKEICEMSLVPEYLKPKLHRNRLPGPIRISEVFGGVLHMNGVRCCGKITDVFRPRASSPWHEQLHKLCFDILIRNNQKGHPLGISALQTLFYVIYQGRDSETGQRLSVPPDPVIAFQLFRFYGCINMNLGLPSALGDENIDDQRFVVEYGPQWSQAGFGSYRELVSAIDAAICKDMTPKPDSLRTLLPLMIQEENSLGKLQLPSAQGLQARVFGSSREKAIFQTKDGYIGLGPVGLKEGDQACILDRVSLPMLLRKDGKGYRNVGVCYVYGASDNEVAGTVETTIDPRFERFEIH
ncbi:heterokaryon incompatibility protein-domain-containing protein [Hypoxylon rubiginosum]|uniref:Heterokaryon incompatibility protein-domain-containing protein n=1 Tax=Hypoxylon rubiginosum TaxID=110542 RepID=A0ACB9YV93_9PEZI|nr:heterokaryon incompatibility protein-domain-containing protein [Hypoxylon rubiginosum]